jgi:hypothetical protein
MVSESDRGESSVPQNLDMGQKNTPTVTILDKGFSQKKRPASGGPFLGVLDGFANAQLFESLPGQ